MTSDDTNDESAPTPEESSGVSEQAGATDETAPGAQLDPAAVASTGEESPADATTAEQSTPVAGTTAADTTMPQQPSPEVGAVTAAPAPQDNNGHSPGGVVAGAAAIVSTVLGAMSLLGNSLSDMLLEHKKLSSQIESMSGGGGGDEIANAYTHPWHTVALTNGIIAVVAVLLGGVTLAAWLHARDTKWAKAVALGGMILGVIGVLVSAGMYFDWFATPPEMPQQPQMPGMG